MSGTIAPVVDRIGTSVPPYGEDVRLVEAAQYGVARAVDGGLVAGPGPSTRARSSGLSRR